MEAEPEMKYGTQKAMQELADELNLPSKEWMQDWPYEVVVPDDIEKYVECYNKTKDEDKKFFLMEMLLQSIEEQIDEEKYIHYWNIVKKIIEDDFIIHEHTIWYWCAFEEKNIADVWRITPLLRELWHKKRGKI